MRFWGLDRGKRVSEAVAGANNTPNGAVTARKARGAGPGAWGEGSSRNRFRDHRAARPYGEGPGVPPDDLKPEKTPQKSHPHFYKWGVGSGWRCTPISRTFTSK